MNNTHRFVLATGASQGIGAGPVAGYSRRPSAARATEPLALHSATTTALTPFSNAAQRRA